MNLHLDWTRLGVECAVQTAFLTVALRLMLKQQKLECKFRGVLGSALLASALLHIPYAGILISLVVLTMCITKAIGARTFTDAVVAVGVSFAILIVFNLLVFSLLLPMLRPSVRVQARTAGTNVVVQSAVLPTNQITSNNPSPTAAPAVEPTATLAATATVVVAPQPAAAATNLAPPAHPSEPAFNTNQLNSARMAGDIYLHYFVKGVSQGAAITLAMISNGKKNYDVAEGDTVRLETSTGRIVNVRCESVAESRVILSVDGVRVTLKRK